MRCPSTQATRVLMHIEGTIIGECEELKLPYVGVTPAELKKAFTGSGSASKQQMIQAARLKFHIKRPITDHEADALGVLSWALQKKRKGEL